MKKTYIVEARNYQDAVAKVKKMRSKDGENDFNTFQEVLSELGDDVDPFDMLKWLSNHHYLNMPYTKAKKIMELLEDDEFDTVEEDYPEVTADEEFIWDTVDDMVTGNPYSELFEAFKTL